MSVLHIWEMYTATTGVKASRVRGVDGADWDIRLHTAQGHVLLLKLAEGIPRMRGRLADLAGAGDMPKAALAAWNLAIRPLTAAGLYKQPSHLTLAFNIIDGRALGHYIIAPTLRRT